MLPTRSCLELRKAGVAEVPRLRSEVSDPPPVLIHSPLLAPLAVGRQRAETVALRAGTWGEERERLGRVGLGLGCPSG